MALRIRSAGPEDAGEIGLIHVLGWQNSYRHIVPAEILDAFDPAERARDFREFMEEHPSKLMKAWLAEDGGEAVGFAVTAPAQDEDLDPVEVGELLWIYLLPDTQGKGYGRQLFDHAIGYLCMQDFKEGVLWTFEENARARRFYEKAGWGWDGTLRERERPGYVLRDVRYRKSL